MVPISSVTSAAAFGGTDALVAAAKTEGTLNVITLPPDWANYGEIMKAFTAKHGIKINSANPDGSSADEITDPAMLTMQTGRKPTIRPLSGEQRLTDRCRQRCEYPARNLCQADPYAPGRGPYARPVRTPNFLSRSDVFRPSKVKL